VHDVEQVDRPVFVIPNRAVAIPENAVNRLGIGIAMPPVRSASRYQQNPTSGGYLNVIGKGERRLGSASPNRVFFGVLVPPKAHFEDPLVLQKQIFTLRLFASLYLYNAQHDRLILCALWTQKISKRAHIVWINNLF
jgi:hypothetical protein